MSCLAFSCLYCVLRSVEAKVLSLLFCSIFFCFQQRRAGWRGEIALHFSCYSFLCCFFFSLTSFVGSFTNVHCFIFCLSFFLPLFCHIVNVLYVFLPQASFLLTYLVASFSYDCVTSVSSQRLKTACIIISFTLNSFSLFILLCFLISYFFLKF